MKVRLRWKKLTGSMSGIYSCVGDSTEHPPISVVHEGKNSWAVSIGSPEGPDQDRLTFGSRDEAFGYAEGYVAGWLVYRRKLQRLLGLEDLMEEWAQVKETANGKKQARTAACHGDVMEDGA